MAALVGYQFNQGEAPDSDNGLKALIGKDKKGRKYVVKQNISNVLSIVSNGWKYIEPSKGTKINKETNTELGNLNAEQLYNLKSDPGEKNNVAAANPQKVAELKSKLNAVKDKK